VSRVKSARNKIRTITCPAWPFSISGASSPFSPTPPSTTRPATNRGQALPLPDQAQGVVTYHPSFLLRLPDQDARARAYADFVDVPRLAGRLAGLT